MYNRKNDFYLSIENLLQIILLIHRIVSLQMFGFIESNIFYNGVLIGGRYLGFHSNILDNLLVDLILGDHFSKAVISLRKIRIWPPRTLFQWIFAFAFS